MEWEEKRERMRVWRIISKWTKESVNGSFNRGHGQKEFRIGFSNRVHEEKEWEKFEWTRRQKREFLKERWEGEMSAWEWNKEKHNKREKGKMVYPVNIACI